MPERRLSPFQRAMLRWCQPRVESDEQRVARPSHSPLSTPHSSLGDAILDTAAWLEAHGWAGTDRGWLQCYSLWLIARREEYARTGGT